MSFFNEKLNEAKHKYSVYDEEFYVIVQALQNWRHYLFPKEFVLYIDNLVLRYLNSESRLKQRHEMGGIYVELHF